jgi:hypothetical protein
MRRIIFAMSMLCLFTAFTFAQNTTGRIVGTTSAADGAIPGATIVVRDNQTARERTVVANSDGTFEVAQLEFGTYTVTITATGYKTFSATDVKIDAGREYPLNAVLEVGQVSEQVTVVAGAAETINSTNAELSTTISTQQVRELPLNGRNPLSLISLQAGANPTTNSINGQRSTSTQITRDGLNVQDNFIRTGRFVGDRPSVDDVSEVTVVTQNAGVEQGGGSSIIQLVTPRGGSKFHGNLFEFNRNSKFAANTQRNNNLGIVRPFLNRNQFGGSLSGPVPLPGINEGGPTFIRDKGFFFFNYEGFRQAQQSSGGGTTLLPQARNGTFTYITAAGPQTVNVLTGAGLSLTTPANQTAFTNAGGVLSVDPIIQSRFLDLLPTSGNGVTTGTNFQQGVTLNRSNLVQRNQFTTRFDLDINDRNSLNVVYKRNNEANDLPGSSETFAADSTVAQGGPTNLAVVAYRITPTSRFSNEVRGGFQYSEPFFANRNSLPSSFIGQTLFSNPESAFEDQGRNTLYRNIQDNAVYSIGNHSIRFGAQAEFYKFESVNNFGTTPTFNITTTANTNTPGLTAALLPGITQADLDRANNLRFTLAGIVGGASQTANLLSPEQGFGFGPAIDVFNYEIYSGYVSDQWRVRPDFTLNLGLRYELYTPVNAPTAKYLEPVISNPDDILGSLSASDSVLDIVGRNSGTPGNFTKADRDNFAPSVSFAYSPVFEKGFFAGLVSGTVLRGGFRVNYVNDEYVKATSTLVGANPGLGSQTSLARNAAGQTTIRSSLSPRAGFDGLPSFTVPVFNASSIPITIASSTAAGGNLRTTFGADPNLQVQRNYEYNFGIQRSLPFKNVLEVRYVGGFSNSNARTNDFNQVDIQNNGFLPDFLRAQNNCRLQGQTLLTGPNDTRNPLTICTSAAFNAAIVGSQQLTVFPLLTSQGSLTNAANLTDIRNGTIALLARRYVQLGQQGTVRFTPAPTGGPLEILVNGGKYRYNALQAEIRRRTATGISYQVNYTFQKTLTDVLADNNADQNRQGTFLDNNRPELNYGRADYDRTHTLNANMVYELPFGKGKRFLDQGGLVNLLFGGFQFSSIVSLSSGPPLSIIDARSTFGIRNGRQSAFSSLTPNELKELTGIFNTPNGFYFINPKVLFAVATPIPTPGVPNTLPIINGFDLNQPLPAGYALTSVRATSGLNQTPFAGQVFFFNNAGQSGNLPLNFINGTPYLNWDAGLSKNFRISETVKLQIRMEAFNVLNQTVPNFGADLGINSDSFGRITTFYGNRIVQFGGRLDF